MNNNSLQAILNNAGTNESDVKKTDGNEDKSSTPKMTSKKRPKKSRDGKNFISAYIDEKLHKQVKLLAVEEEVTIQDIMTEAFETLLVKKGKI